jgi:hypothetical protein
VRIRNSLVGALAVAGAVQVGAARAAVPRAPEAEAARIARFTALGREAPCAQARRKLWVDGRGWIVRRVPACR